MTIIKPFADTKSFAAVDTSLSKATEEATTAALVWIQDQADRYYRDVKIVTSLAITPTGRYAFTMTVLMHY